MSKVVIKECKEYDVSQIYQRLKEALESLGGIENIITKEEKILLKPNFMAAREPEKVVTTHPAIFEAVVKYLRDMGYSKIYYGDSPGTGAPLKASRVTGTYEVAEKYDIPLLEFRKGKTVTFEDGVFARQFEIAQGALEVDAIINLPKMKSHGFMRITGATKNIFGCVYGFNKGISHTKFQDPYEFAGMIADLNRLLKPRLHIMDGIIAMEGNGPGSGTPVAMNTLLISQDSIALDSTFARLIDLDINYVPIIIKGTEMGVGVSEDHEIELLGDSLEKMLNRSFDVERLPVKDERVSFDGKIKPFKNLLLRKPVINKKLCIKCGICVESCPLEEKALTFSGELGKSFPKYDYNKCIRCYCCQEMCPKEAIDVKTPLLGKLLVYRD
jgi:uncharacterized protein (DUF362 family)/NAD-dependent dihydropyrimidine dehydrogenase PreA subunit